MSLTVTVTDSADAAISGASVQKPAGHLLGHTDASGRFTFECEIPCRVRIDAEGFIGNYFELTANQTVHLERAGATEEITVTAYREPLGELESPVTTRTLSANALATTAAITLDDEVRQLPGVELFRRSSSLVANPTSQGISVRGLGSTSASRTLVTQDDVPLNDPIGGWIHWEEQPELAIQSAELVRGGASDLYGSSAIGGVLNMITVRPTTDLVEVRSSYGGEGTYDTARSPKRNKDPGDCSPPVARSAPTATSRKLLSSAAPSTLLPTCHSQNGLFDAEHLRGPLRFFARGSGFNEARGNGTPFQTNGTRLWRYAAGGDWQRTHGDSAVLRSTDRRNTTARHSRASSTRPIQRIQPAPFAAAKPLRVCPRPGQRTRRGHPLDPSLRRGPVLLAGADVHDVRYWDREQPSAPPRAHHPDDHQRDSGLYAEGMWVHRAWTFSASARMDWFQNYDGFRAREQWKHGYRLRPSPPKEISASSIRAWASRANFCSIGPSPLPASAPFALLRPASSTAPPK